SIVTDGNKVYAGGKFSGFSGTGGGVRDKVAAFNLDGTLDPDWKPAVQSWNGVYSVLAVNDMVYIGGDFYGVNGTYISDFAAIDATGALDTDIKPYPSGSWIEHLEYDGSNIIVSGALWGMGSVYCKNVCAMDPDGTVLDWKPQVNNTVYRAHAGNGMLHLGGVFSSIDGKTGSSYGEIDLP
ncbi:MAG: hypothetical protein OEX19_17855, partial [Gammaproteobacteria bacterium]|nr:hypothetical protein [Gammaproteobacteria bacterium]